MIQADKQRRMQQRIEKYLDENENLSTTNFTILNDLLMKLNESSIGNASKSNSKLTTTVVRIEESREIDSQLEKALREIELSSEQSLNEMNNLFNEVDIRRKRREIPEYLTCKLCYDLMRDPVITPCKFVRYQFSFE